MSLFSYRLVAKSDSASENRDSCAPLLKLALQASLSPDRLKNYASFCTAFSCKGTNTRAARISCDMGRAFKAGWFSSHLWHGSLRLHKIAHALLMDHSLCALEELQKREEICLWEQFIWYCAWKMSQPLSPCESPVVQFTRNCDSCARNISADGTKFGSKYLSAHNFLIQV